MNLYEEELDLELDIGNPSIFEKLSSFLYSNSQDKTPIRFVITGLSENNRGHSQAQSMLHCELGVLTGLSSYLSSKVTQDTELKCPKSILEFRQRQYQNESQFTTVFLVPTGIDAEIGGHCGDATPAARTVAAACDRLIVHPNIVNAADINELSRNMLYVEGSVISRLMMGAVGIIPTRANRLLAILHKHEEDIIWQNAVNSVNAARAAAGFSCEQIEVLPGELKMVSETSSSGRAIGRISGFNHVCDSVMKHRRDIDAIAISSLIEIPRSTHDAYFDPRESAVDSVIPPNPYGGIEALLTHALSSIFEIPTAHSPMYENEELMNSEADIVDPRKAADCVSVSFLHCILKGLQIAPRITSNTDAFGRNGVISAEDLSCLVIPKGCIGLPVIAALHQGIKVIEVNDVNNTNLMRNDLGSLPWAKEQYYKASSYFEAAGLISAMRAGVTIDAVRRPIRKSQIDVEIGLDSSVGSGNPKFQVV